MKILALDPGETCGMVRLDVSTVSKLGAVTPVFVRAVPPSAV